MHHLINASQNWWTTKDDAEHVDLIVSMFNLIEHSSDYSETTGSSWFYSKDEATNVKADISNNNIFKSFNYTTKLSKDIEADGNNGIIRYATITVSLKYLNNFWRLLE